PWVSWFVYCSYTGICGWCVTPTAPSRHSIHVAIRDALERGNGHGPFGGIPAQVRVDRGQDFLSKSIAQVMGAFGVRRMKLPPSRPDLKPYVEAANAAVKVMHYQGLPGFTQAPDEKGKQPEPPAGVEGLLTFEEFTARLQNWIHWWNTEHPIRTLGDQTPLAVWNADLTVIHDAPLEALHRHTLELVSRTFTIGPTGIHWGKRQYVEAWMRDHQSERVRLRYLPRHLSSVEVYDAATDAHLGTAAWTNEADRELIVRVKQANADDARRLRAQLRRRKEICKDRYAATSTPGPPQRLNHLTQDQAELLTHRHADRPAPPPAATLPQATSSWSPASGTAPPRPAPPHPPGRELPEPTASWQPAPHPGRKPGTEQDGAP
ncbi:Mu transposase C-terminal domain-containing protein, partial [Streptomyces violascens]|uniref:Mu transposase C-terminal domain-containing protein n=1 Tax=Streptomyces violascens TaxID=67381 RepID=UPI00368B1E36